MSENSNIEWTDHTFNPWIGCTKVSPGCANCYAETMAKFRGWAKWGKGETRQRTSAANWKQPLKWNKDYEHARLVNKRHDHPLNMPARPRVFCASLADWLDDEVPIEWLADLLKLIHDTPHLDWLLLTKRPENWYRRISLAVNEHSDMADAWLDCVDMPERGDIPHNVWIGTTVENQEFADKRIPELLKIPARVRFLSCEPLLGPVDLMGGFDGPQAYPLGRWINWVICGGESGPRKRHVGIGWAHLLMTQCENAGAAFFMKQIDKVQPIPTDLMRRQFPEPTPTK